MTKTPWQDYLIKRRREVSPRCECTIEDVKEAYDAGYKAGHDAGARAEREYDARGIYIFKRANYKFSTALGTSGAWGWHCPTCGYCPSPGPINSMPKFSECYNCKERLTTLPAPTEGER